MPKLLRLLMVGFLALGLLTAGCGGQDEEVQDTSQGPEQVQNETAVNVQSLEGKNELTSIEAAALACEEARKWRDDAVLWYMKPKPGGLSEQWRENDTAFEWHIIFVNKSDDKRYNMNIQADKIVENYEEKHVTRVSDIPDNLPACRPGVSMQEAAQAVFNDSFPQDIRPGIVYLVDNPGQNKYMGIPVWEFSFGLDINGKNQFYHYTVDGLNGELLEISGENGQPLDPPVLEKQADEQQEKPQQSSRASAEEFFAAVDQGRLDQAMGYMTSNMAGNESVKQMWKDSLGTIDSIKITGIEETSREEWTDSSEKYKTTLMCL